MENLFAIAQESKDDISSTFKIYKLNFQSISSKDLADYAESNTRHNMLIAIILLIVLLITIFSISHYRKINKNKANELLSYTSKEIQLLTHEKNAIYMFGDFKVLDKASKDMTHQFSTKLKQALCVILEHTTTDGITSKYLSNILWPEKSKDRVKNSRGVTINHLRKALSELDGFDLQFDKGKYKIVQSQDAYCDFTRRNEILNNHIGSYCEELIHILNRASFLQFSNDPIFDNLKTKLERQLEATLSTELVKSINENQHFISLQLANVLLKIDPLNDFGLLAKIKTYTLLKQEVEARTTYQFFVIEYKRLMSENYTYTYEELIKSSS